MSKEAFDIFTFFLFGCINNSCLLNRIASSSLSYTVNVAPSSPSPFPVMESVMFGLVLGHELPPVVIGTTASQSGRRQLFRILQAMAHLTCHTAHICCLWPAAGPAGCSASFATCPVSVRGALVSLPAGENSCLMMFKEAEYFPSHVRLWGRKQCLAHVSSVPSCTSCSSLLLHELWFLGGEDIQSFGCEWWWNQCLAGALCWEVWQGVSVCLLILPWGLLSFSSTPPTPCCSPTVPSCPLSCCSTQNASVPALAWGGPAGLFSLSERWWSWILQFPGDASSHYYCLKFKMCCWLSPGCLLQRPTV